MKNKLFVGMVAAIALAVFTFLFLSKDESKDPTVATKPEVAKQVASEMTDRFIREHSPRFGNSLARVTVVEWFDPECEACRAIHPIVKKVMADYRDRVHFVYRYMPYHKGSMFAASCLEEAKEFGKFEQALDILFAKQPEWGDHHAPRPELIPTYLTELGIPAEKLDEQTVIAKHGSKVRIDQEDGIKVGVQGTPSFFVNGRPVAGLGDEFLRSAIDAALSESVN